MNTMSMPTQEQTEDDATRESRQEAHNEEMGATSKFVVDLVRVELEHNPRLRMNNRLLLGILLVLGVGMSLGLWDMFKRTSEENRIRQENEDLKVAVAACSTQLSTGQIEKQHGEQLGRLAATQEAENSAIARVGRDLSVQPSKKRDDIDVVRAITRRYITVNELFQSSTKDRDLIISELCNLYYERGISCY
jgi:uncharacterized protein HemX